MKTEKAKRASGTGSVGLVAGSKNYYIWYRVNGRQIRESSGSPDEVAAEKLLQKRLVENGMGLRPAQDIKGLRYEDIRDPYIENFRIQGGSFIKRADGTEEVRGVAQLDEHFENMRVTAITSDEIRRYIKSREKQGVSGPTIRRELVTLRAMMNLAKDEGKLGLADIPHFSMPEDSDAAGRYISPKEFGKIRENLPENLRLFYTFLYGTGCREGAARKITWDMVSPDRTVIKAPGMITKNGEPLTIVLAGELLEPVVTALKKKFSKANEYVFDSTNYRTEWSRAVAESGIGTFDPKTRKRTGVRIHDCRVSAAVNLIEAGNEQDDVMKIGGWKTTSTFSRYNIVDVARTRKAMEKGGNRVAARMNGTDK
jgi:integrase